MPAGDDRIVAVGNDLVALDVFGAAGKSGHRRFVDRVFSPAEQALIRGSEHPDTTLWSLWAAKETAFKVAAKLHPGLPFSPRAFLVEPDDDPAGRRGELRSGMFRTGVVEHDGKHNDRHDGLHCTVAWTYGPGWVHCIGCIDTDTETSGPDSLSGLIAAVLPLEQALRLAGAPGVPGDRDAPGPAGIPPAVGLTEVELRSVSGPDSLGVRLLARKLLSEAGLPGARILRLRLDAHRFSPPWVEWNGTRLARDISLSHDGGRVAVVLGPAGGHRTG